MSPATDAFEHVHLTSRRCGERRPGDGAPCMLLVDDEGQHDGLHAWPVVLYS